MTPKKAMARNIMKTLVASTVDLRTSYLNLGFYLKCKPPAKIFGEWVNIAWKRHRKPGITDWGCGYVAYDQSNRTWGNEIEN
jgi:hypothetical protein